MFFLFFFVQNLLTDQFLFIVLSRLFFVELPSAGGTMKTGESRGKKRKEERETNQPEKKR